MLWSLLRRSWFPLRPSKLYLQNVENCAPGFRLLVRTRKDLVPCSVPLSNRCVGFRARDGVLAAFQVPGASDGAQLQAAGTSVSCSYWTTVRSSVNCSNVSFSSWPSSRLPLSSSPMKYLFSVVYLMGTMFVEMTIHPYLLRRAAVSRSSLIPLDPLGPLRLRL